MQTYETKKELTRHNLYYCYAKPTQANNTLTEMRQLKKLDRSKQLQEGVPRETTDKYQKNTRYNVETEKWECKLCPKTI